MTLQIFFMTILKQEWTSWSKSCCIFVLKKQIILNFLLSPLCFRKRSGYVSTARLSGSCPAAVSTIPHFPSPIPLPNTSQWARPVTRRRPLSRALSTNPPVSRAPKPHSLRCRSLPPEQSLAARLRLLLPNSQLTPRPRRQLRHR